ncbi:MAG: MFS transporter [Pseudomonadota bacterium]
MVSTLTSFLALYSAVFTLLMGVGLLGTFLSLRMTMAGFSTEVIGLILAAYYVGLVLGSFVCQRLVARVGHIRTFAALAAVATAAVMLHGVFFSAWAWGLLRLVTGIATMGLYMVIESWLNECTEPRYRGRVFSIYMVLSYLGIGIGQILLNLADPALPTHFFIAGMLLALCLVPVSLTTAISPSMPAPARFNLLVILKKAPLGMVGCLTAGLINSAFYAMGPVFGHGIGLSVAQLSLLMGATVLGGLLLQWPVGLISDRFDRTLVLPALAVMVSAISALVVFTAGLSFGGLLVIMVCFGGVFFTIYPVAVARSHDLFDAGEVVSVSAGLLLCYGIGASVGPVVAAFVMNAVSNPYGLFIFMAVVPLMYAAMAHFLRRREMIEIVPVAAQAAYMPMMRTSAVVIAIDPRVEPEAAGE